MSKLKVTILGSGGSFGVPVLANRWGACDQNNSKNLRTRPSAVIMKDERTLLIDTPPDLRQQLIQNHIINIDSVLYTHSHADHTHGINDLRAINLINKPKGFATYNNMIPVYADKATKETLLNSFNYLFTSKNIDQYPPICEIKDYEGGNTYNINGFKIKVIKQNHGSIDSLGFIIDDKIAYNLDVKYFYESDYLKSIQGIDCWIVGCLRYEDHPAHAKYDQVIDWINAVKPKQAYLSHMTAMIDYETEYKKLSKYNIYPSFDGCEINL